MFFLHTAVMLPSCVHTRVGPSMTSDVSPRGPTGVGVRRDSVLPALTRETEKLRLITKKLFSCQTVRARGDRSGRRHEVSVCFLRFLVIASLKQRESGQY